MNDYNSFLFDLLNSETENELLEFKAAKNNFDKNLLGQYFSGLSNESNLKNKKCAYILFGVDDNKKICGTKISEAQINTFKHEIFEYTSPSISFSDVAVYNTDEGRVICFQIPAAPKGMPISWKGHFYGRAGESLVALDILEFEKIRSEIKKEDWSAGIIEGATIADLSKEAIDFAKIQFSARNPHLSDDIKEWNDITFLNKARLTINGKITRTAIILLGKPEADCLLSPSTSKITWILKDKEGMEKDYEHFTCPLLLNVEKVHSRIRNLTYRYIKDGSLFPEEILQYDGYVIREALNNCIAHQDYTRGGKIILVENEYGELIFTNLGDFIPGTVENVLISDSPEPEYRNSFLASAMVNLKLIDTIGSGIRKMFYVQRDRCFPLPEYDFSNHKVKLTIIGKVLDLNYARKLASNKDLSLSDIILLDKVQKKKKLTCEEFKTLKNAKLIEGRKNNFIISSSIAKITNQEADYTKLKGFDDKYYKDLILSHIEQFGFASRSEINRLLMDKLPDSLSFSQKNNKIKNLLQALRTENLIVVENKKWKRNTLNNLD